MPSDGRGPGASVPDCGACEGDLEHCHATAIVHLDGTAECSDDPDCVIAADLHLGAIACEDEHCCVPG